MGTQLPFAVRDIPHMEIPLSDGCKLSARVWMPESDKPVPAILEYLPYRKRDGTAARDALTHPYLAGHGYACVRVDQRGCGDSEGLFVDEYSEQELSDGVEIVNWLAAQGWCSGNVGMMGISWGGFNGLQIAARAPEALKAVISICSSVDRFGDDIHYKGGVMLGENPGWAATALSWFSMPPDPEIVGDRWREMWLERLENTPFQLKTWSQHQTRDAFWQHGSVCEDYASIKAAVLSVGGWHDGYRNTISHLVKNMTSPVKGLIGPWNHKYPHIGMPGPQIDFLGEILRWYDHWLKGIDRDVENDPDMRVYMLDSIAPAVSYEHRPGRWVGVKEWPSGGTHHLHFNRNEMMAEAGPVDRLVTTQLECGKGTGEYFPFGFGPGELPDDQTADDGRSCCFDSARLESEVSLLGAPTVKLRLASDRTFGQIAVRLCDLREDGTSALIAHGFLNLRQRNGHETSEPLVPGENYDVTVALDQCGYVLPVGHRLRIAISASYWPFVWPEGEDVTLSVTGGSLSLGLLPEENLSPCSFGPPASAPPLEIHRLTDRVESKDVGHDRDTGVTVMRILGDDGVIEDLNTGLKIGSMVNEAFSISHNDPASAVAKFVWDRSLARGNWGVSSHAEVEMSSDANAFHIQMSLSAKEKDEEIFSRKWKASVPRV